MTRAKDALGNYQELHRYKLNREILRFVTENSIFLGTRFVRKCLLLKVWEGTLYKNISHLYKIRLDCAFQGGVSGNGNSPFRSMVEWRNIITIVSLYDNNSHDIIRVCQTIIYRNIYYNLLLYSTFF